MREAIERVIDDLENLKNDPEGVEGDLFDSGFDCGLSAAQERLREVLNDDPVSGKGNADGRGTNDPAEQMEGR